MIAGGNHTAILCALVRNDRSGAERHTDRSLRGALRAICQSPLRMQKCIGSLFLERCAVVSGSAPLKQETEYRNHERARLVGPWGGGFPCGSKVSNPPQADSLVTFLSAQESYPPEATRDLAGDCHTSDIGHWFAMTVRRWGRRSLRIRSLIARRECKKPPRTESAEAVCCVVREVSS